LQRPSAGFTPNWAEEGFENTTLRQVVRLTAGGTAVRIRLSNQYGTTPLAIAGATIGRSAGGASITQEGLRELSFKHQSSIVIPAGEQILTDDVLLSTEPAQSLVVSLYLRERSGPATFHATANANTYRAGGDHRNDINADAFTESATSWYYLADVETAGGAAQPPAIVAFGDSITDGVGSTTDSNNRYPDELAEYFQEHNDPRPVLNLGITANRILTDSAWYGDKAMDRFQRDVIDKPGVGTVIVLAGINDIGFSDWNIPTATPKPEISLEQLTAGQRSLITRARSKGIRTIGATLLPFKGCFYYTERGERIRDALNDWIRTSAGYDVVVDFDRIMAAPGDPDQLTPAYDSGDHLHPNDVGYRVMARSIDPSSFR
jgi:lysophospholipase L1-like esterase